MFIKQYILPAFRHISRNKVSTTINMTSLVVGFTCFILIAFWIKHEFSYDNFHPKADRTYRVSYTGVLLGKEIKDATTSKAFNEALINNFPEVEAATIIFNFNEALLSKDDGVSFRTKLSGVNPNFFEVFAVEVLKGDVNELNKPNTAFITNEMAIKFFGDEDPVGKIISTGMDRENKKFTIAGVVGKLPENSHFDFDVLYSNTSMSWYKYVGKNWLDADFHNYLVLKPNIDYKAFEEKFNSYVLKNITPIIEKWQKISIEEWHEKGDWLRFVFQPINRIHLNSSFDGEYKQNGNIVYVYIFLIIGILILLISIINFSNLSTVKSLSRSKEIGIRKVSGSKRNSLILKFMVESCLHSFVALLISTFIIVLISPHFQNFSGVKILSFDNLKWWVFASLLLLTILSGLIAGAFPSLYLSKLSPIKVLSSGTKIKLKGVFFKDVLIVIQFVISIVVIIGSFLVTKQLNYLQNENLGFKKENILVIKGTEDLSWEKNLLLNKELQKISSIKYSSSSHYIPNDDCAYNVFSHKTQTDIETVIIDVLPCDYNFKNVYQFELLDGEFFDESFSEKARKIVLNEKAAESLNIKNCIGEVIRREGADYEIIGVVKDFHYNSKQSEIPPLGLVQLPDVFEYWSPIYCSILIEGNNIQASIDNIEKVWKKIAPGTEFNYSFFDQDYDKLYRQEMQAKKVFMLFSFIAISLSCFGLFGFVKYQVQARTKEIGVRKVNGARNGTLYFMLLKHFTKPVGIALILAYPIAYFAAKGWLENFAYKIEIGVFSFLLAGILTIIIVFLTVGWLSWRAASRNPVEALRYE